LATPGGLTWDPTQPEQVKKPPTSVAISLGHQGEAVAIKKKAGLAG